MLKRMADGVRHIPSPEQVQQRCQQLRRHLMLHRIRHLLLFDSRGYSMTRLLLQDDRLTISERQSPPELAFSSKHVPGQLAKLLTFYIGDQVDMIMDLSSCTPALENWESRFAGMELAQQLVLLIVLDQCRPLINHGVDVTLAQDFADNLKVVVDNKRRFSNNKGYAAELQQQLELQLDPTTLTELLAQFGNSVFISLRPQGLSFGAFPKQHG